MKNYHSKILGLCGISLLLLSLLATFLPLNSNTAHANNVAVIKGTVYDTDGSVFIQKKSCQVGASGGYYPTSAKQIEDALTSIASTAGLAGIFAIWQDAQSNIEPLDTVCAYGTPTPAVNGKVQDNNDHVYVEISSENAFFSFAVEVMNDQGQIEKTSKLIVSYIENGKTASDSYKFYLRDDPGKKILTNEENVTSKNFEGWSDFFMSPLKFAQDKFSLALGDAIKKLIDFINTATSFFSANILKVLNKGNEVTNIAATQASWLKIRDVAASLLMLGIIIIAFANVLSLDIETFGINRMIPKFVMFTILAFLSFLVAKIMMEFATVLQTQLQQIIAGISPVAPQGIQLNASGMDVSGDIGTWILLVAIGFGLVIALAYLYLVLIARVVTLNFLVIIAPVAFIFGILPWTEGLYKRWWSEFAKWIFMGPAVMGLLAIGSIIVNATLKEANISPNSAGLYEVDSLNHIYTVLTAATAYGLAAMIPTMMGGQVMSAWSKRVKGAMKMGGRGLATVTGAKWAKDQTIGVGQQFFKQRGAVGERKISEKAQGLREKLGEGAVGRWATGMDEKERRSIIAKRGKEIQDIDSQMSLDEKNDFALEQYTGPNKQIKAMQHDRLNREAMAKNLGDKGLLDDDHARDSYGKWGQKYGQTLDQVQAMPNKSMPFKLHEFSANDIGKADDETWNATSTRRAPLTDSDIIKASKENTNSLLQLANNRDFKGKKAKAMKARFDGLRAKRDAAVTIARAGGGVAAIETALGSAEAREIGYIDSATGALHANAGANFADYSKKLDDITKAHNW